MKKILLTGTALIAFAAASYSQVIQQGGLQNQAFQNQANAQQTGTIQQIEAGGGTNYGNYAVTFQGPSGAGPQVANIFQNSGPNVTPAGTGGTLATDQGSQGNRAGITQNQQIGSGPGGTNNVAQISQTGGARGISGGGTSTPATLGAAGGDGNFAGILQQGTNNNTGINQDNNSRLNFSEIYQNGAFNNAIVAQSNNSVNNRGTITQGFTGANGQSAAGTAGPAVSNLQAYISQGPVGATDVSGGNAIAETVNSRANINQIGGNNATIARIGQGTTAASAATGFATPGNSATGGGGTAGRADGVTANIFQNSANQAANITQGANSAEAIGSQANIVQTAQISTATINQAVGNSNGSDLNSSANIVQSAQNSIATITQGSSGQTDGNTATIYQTATNNTGSITQGSVGVGAGNTAYSALSASDVATLLMNGSNNTATINQNIGISTTSESSGRNNTAGILQDATVNQSVAAIDQGVGVNGAAAGATTAVSIRNIASIFQGNGSQNLARISQGRGNVVDANGTAFTATGAANSGSLTPLSGAALVVGFQANDSQATINQVGNNQSANINSSGRFNQASIAQAGSFQRALIVQTNSSQRAQAVINQGVNGPPGASNNDAVIMQFNGSNADGRGGFGNQAIISQLSGSANVAFIQQGAQQGAGASQSSNDNFASLTQNGSNNTARMIQLGNNNFFSIEQRGNQNTLQGNGVVAVTNPFNAALQNGYNNRLTLIQDSTNGVPRTFNYSQTGSNNSQTINQTPNP